MYTPNALFYLLNENNNNNKTFGSHGLILYLCTAMCSRELSGDVCLVNILPIESFASSLFLYLFILDVLETITNTLACIAL